MKSAGNGGVVHDRLQVLPIHVFLVAPLGACHMAQPRADQHQERHLKPHGIRPHSRQSPSKQLHFRTLRPSCGAGRCRPRRRMDSARPIQLYNFLGHSLLSPFSMVCRDFILPEPASYVFFCAGLLCTLYGAAAPKTDASATQRKKPSILPVRCPPAKMDTLAGALLASV